MLIFRREPLRPGWHPDPTRRHQLREWDGACWTEHVADFGRAAIDPIPSRRRARRPKPSGTKHRATKQPSAKHKHRATKQPSAKHKHRVTKQRSAKHREPLPKEELDTDFWQRAARRSG